MDYRQCCAPYHRGEREAPDAVALMRSRFAAFAVGDADYLVRTLDEGHPDRALPRDELLRSLRSAKDRFRYMGLTVLDHHVDDDRAEVLFHAVIYERGKERSFVELSDFARTADGAAWRYLSGVNVPFAQLRAPIKALTIDAFLEARPRPGAGAS